jgi:endonuclease YncB( thermonuclease family)
MASAQTLSGQAEVVDGDTLSIRGEKARIRLYGVDTPEGQQICEDASSKRYLCGSRAAEALSSLVGRNGRVTCQEEDRDRYGRIVAVCQANGREINAELIRQGRALEYKESSDGRYADEEAEARARPGEGCGPASSSSRGTGAAASGWPQRLRPD